MVNNSFYWGGGYEFSIDVRSVWVCCVAEEWSHSSNAEHWVLPRTFLVLTVILARCHPIFFIGSFTEEPRDGAHYLMFLRQREDVPAEVGHRKSNFPSSLLIWAPMGQRDYATWLLRAPRHQQRTSFHVPTLQNRRARPHPQTIRRYRSAIPSTPTEGLMW